jgi:hypothetical protein
MALSNEKLYYRRSGITESVNTYTALSDVGTEALKVRVNGADRYIALGDETDSKKSFLRIRKNGIIKAILKSVIDYVGSWTLIVTTNYNAYRYWTVYFDYDKVFSESDMTNFKFVGNMLNTKYKIDGVEYTATTTLVNGMYVTERKHRLTTGNHTIGLTATLVFSTSSSASAYRVV